MAIYSGYNVTARHDGEIYHIKVKEGARGMDIPATACLVNGVWQVSSQGERLTVLNAVKFVPEKREEWYGGSRRSTLRKY